MNKRDSKFANLRYMASLPKDQVDEMGKGKITGRLARQCIMAKDTFNLILIYLK